MIRRGRVKNAVGSKRVTDTVGRVMKFHYGLSVSRSRQITKVEYGRGTKDALTEVYQTVNYEYQQMSYPQNRPPRPRPVTWRTSLTKVRLKLGAGDPRGSELVTTYEYVQHGLVTGIVLPSADRIEFDNRIYGLRAVRRRAKPASAGAAGEVLHERVYGPNYYYDSYYRKWKTSGHSAYDTDLQTPLQSPPHRVVTDWSSASRRRVNTYNLSDTATTIAYDLSSYFRWNLRYGNIAVAYQVHKIKRQWYYRLHYGPHYFSHDTKKGECDEVGTGSTHFPVSNGPSEVGGDL